MSSKPFSLYIVTLINPESFDKTAASVAASELMMSKDIEAIRQLILQFGEDQAAFYLWKYVSTFPIPVREQVVFFLSRVLVRTGLCFKFKLTQKLLTRIYFMVIVDRDEVSKISDYGKFAL